MGRVVPRARTGEVPGVPLPSGTPEQMISSWEKAETYLYKILSFAPKDSYLTKEELDEIRRDMVFMRYGPRVKYLVGDKRTKLTSADVLYILTCTIPSKQLSELYDVDPETIRGIRSNKQKEWVWEYNLIKRLTTTIKANYFQSDITGNRIIPPRIYKLSELQDNGEFKIILYCSGIRKARILRADLIPKRKFNSLVKNKTLEIIYPIEALDII